MASATKNQEPADIQLAKLSSSGFLALPRDLVRLCWRHLRLKEIALLVALIDLADGRWSMPLALVELAKAAHLSAGGARETAAHLERAGLISREQTAPGVYRWRLAVEGYSEIAHHLAHRSRLKVKPRPAQTSLCFEESPPVMPAPIRPRLALLPPPLPLDLRPPAAPPLAPLPPERAPESPTLPDTIPAPPPTVPAPPLPPDTERIDPWPNTPPLRDVAETLPAATPEQQPGPETPSALGISLGRLVQLAARPLGDDEAPAPIQGAPRPDSGRHPAPIQGAPRPDLGRPYLVNSKPLPNRDKTPVNRRAQAPRPEAGSAGETDGTEGGIWTEQEREGLIALAIELSGPDLHASPVRVRLASLEALLSPAALVERFMREEIPAARDRGARFPFAAAFSRWAAWQDEQARKAAPPRPVLAPLASPPAIRQVGDTRRAPSVSEGQKNLNLEGARGVLAALRGHAAPRPIVSPAGGPKP